jgi:hypothetical protein
MSMQATVSPAVRSPPSLWEHIAIIIKGVGGNGKDSVQRKTIIWNPI